MRVPSKGQLGGLDHVATDGWRDRTTPSVLYTASYNRGPYAAVFDAQELGNARPEERQLAMRVVLWWCEDQFGPPGERWRYGAMVTRLQEGEPRVFAFRDEADAVAFRMRWSAGVCPKDMIPETV